MTLCKLLVVVLLMINTSAYAESEDETPADSAVETPETVTTLVCGGLVSSALFHGTAHICVGGPDGAYFVTGVGVGLSIDVSIAGSLIRIYGSDVPGKYLMEGVSYYEGVGLHSYLLEKQHDNGNYFPAGSINGVGLGIAVGVKAGYLWIYEIPLSLRPHI